MGLVYIIIYFSNIECKEETYYNSYEYRCYSYGVPAGLTWIIYIFYALTFIPMLSACVRRLHDTGRSGLYYLVILIPIAGIFILLSFLCQDSDPNPNIYGPSPKFVQPVGGIIAPGNAYLPPPDVVITTTPVVTVPVGQYGVPPNPQTNPMAYPQAVPNQVLYQQGPPPQNNIYNQPNPMQPQSSNAYNSTDYSGQ